MGMRSYTIAALLALISTETAWALPDVGKLAPDFVLKSDSGQNVRLSELRGRVVLINFWASWCGPCRQEMPQLAKLYTQYGRAGFVLLGVNVDNDPKNAATMQKQLGVNFPVLFDNAQQVAKLYNPQGMPATLLIDRDGRVRYVYRGYVSGYEQKYEQQIRELLKE